MDDQPKTSEQNPKTPGAPGQLHAIWLKRVRRGPMDPVDTAQLETDKGLTGNANQGGKRQVTILTTERWADVEAELGRSVDPKTRRANLLVSGVDLRDSRGKTLQVGACRIVIRGETRPCRLMEESESGLQAALDPDWRAGAFGQVLDDGEITVGDTVTWV